MRIPTLLQGLPKLLEDNSATILTVVGVVGTVSASYLTVLSTVKATRILDHGLQEPRTKRDVVGEVWKCYIPPAVVIATTCTSIILANRISTRRAAAVASAFAITEKAFSEYRERVVETFGKNKEEEVRADIATRRVARTYGPDTVILNEGGVLCLETFTGRYFRCDLEAVRKAQNDINVQIIRENYASLGDFYDLVGLPSTDNSEELGWTSDKMLEIIFTAVLTPDSKPCLALEYQLCPIRKYDMFS